MNLHNLDGPAHPTPTHPAGPRLLVLCKCGERAVRVFATGGPKCLVCWLGLDGCEWLVSAMVASARKDFGL